jgi:hypothetical protein
MKTLFVLAATAMLLTTASSAFAAEHHIKVRGRADAAIHADIIAAANSVCREDIGSHAQDLMSYCIQDVTRDAIQRSGSPTLAAYAKTQRRAVGLQKTSF